MKLYRVTNKKWADTFNGLGASYEDGARWNSAGYPVIYFALDLATAMIEAANYHPSPDLIPPSHCKAIYEVDDDILIEKLDPSLLPDDWDKMPYPKSTQVIGDAFLSSKSAAILLVPSVGVGVSSEYLIAVVNPNHPDINKIRLIDTQQPVYSKRMFAGLFIG
ncbi:RES family NAD+ phosphorylase [Vibrio parahaemolyticus]|uniref:RES family NAD+ phosphorylase n=1 Tax=Vibrio parahaemolyticus TaxID=670 RepID=UPI000813B9DC|nr:RES family NAD+ phosphorylase [Vibrio parahaemolyticus]OCP68478.1 hypothetical protein AKH08_16855 [Vibrio parahaemolyticus]